MQAIILAAGMGRRLGEYTKDNTKCMVPVNGVRLIDRLLGQLAKQDLKRVIIVVGYQGQALRHYIEEQYISHQPSALRHQTSDLGHQPSDLSRLNIEFAENPIYDKTNNIYSLALVKDKLQEDDTLLIESDLIFSDRIIPMIVNNPYPNLALVAKYETWMDGTMVRLDDDQNIVNFISKDAFDYNEVDSYYKTVNIYKLSKAFSQQKYVPFLDAYTKAVGNNEYYENVLRIISLLNNNHDMKAMPIGGEKWYEIDDKQDLDIAEALFADEKDVLRKYYGRYGGFWRFPQMLDFCYLVNPYFPSKRMKDELRANFDTLLTEYPSGMKVNTLIASKSFGVSEPYIVPGNGAAELIKILMEDTQGRQPFGQLHPQERHPAPGTVVRGPRHPSHRRRIVCRFQRGLCQQQSAQRRDPRGLSPHGRDEEHLEELWCARPSSGHPLLGQQRAHRAHQERGEHLEPQLVCRVLYADLQQARKRLSARLRQVRGRARPFLRTAEADTLLPRDALAGQLLPLRGAAPLQGQRDCHLYAQAAQHPHTRLQPEVRSRPHEAVYAHRRARPCRQHPSR